MPPPSLFATLPPTISLMAFMLRRHAMLFHATAGGEIMPLPSCPPHTRPPLPFHLLPPLPCRPPIYTYHIAIIITPFAIFAHRQSSSHTRHYHTFRHRHHAMPIASIAARHMFIRYRSAACSLFTYATAGGDIVATHPISPLRYHYAARLAFASAAAHYYATLPMPLSFARRLHYHYWRGKGVSIIAAFAYYSAFDSARHRYLPVHQRHYIRHHTPSFSTAIHIHYRHTTLPPFTH